jgi:hypothetical protein
MRKLALSLVILAGSAVGCRTSVGTDSGAPVATVTVTLASPVLVLGQGTDAAATLKDADGNVLSGRDITWSTSNNTVATAASNGHVSTAGAGNVEIIAISEGQSGSATLTVGALVPPPGSVSGLWATSADLAALPTSGAAWNNVKSAADKDLSNGTLGVRDEHNVNTMAAGLVALRLNSDTYRAKVRASLQGLMANPIYSGDPLANLRRLGAYAIAADLADLKNFDPAFDAQFRIWLDQARKNGLDGETPAQYNERRPNNWGTHACVGRVAAALYLGDTAEVSRTAYVFRGWLGDRSQYKGFSYGEDWWQADPANPVGINPVGATKNGHNIDGVLPEEERRSGDFVWPPYKENYVYTGLEGAIGCAVLLSRLGYDVWNWSDQAMLRAYIWVNNVANYPAVSNDGWQPVIINKIYGTNFPVPSTSSITPGKNIGWGEWTHQP